MSDIDFKQWLTFCNKDITIYVWYNFYNNKTIVIFNHFNKTYAVSNVEAISTIVFLQSLFD